MKVLKPENKTTTTKQKALAVFRALVSPVLLPASSWVQSLLWAASALMSLTGTYCVPPEALDCHHTFGFQMFWGLGTLGGGGDLLACFPKLPQLFSLSFCSFLLTSFLFTFGLSESIGISLWTVKIHYLPWARERAESRLQIDLKGCLCLCLYFWGQGTALPSIKYLLYLQPLVIPADAGTGWYDNPKQHQVPSFKNLSWQCTIVKSHEFSLIREASLY